MSGAEALKISELKISLGVNRFISIVTRSEVVRNPSDEVHQRSDGVIIFTLDPRGIPTGKRFIPSDSKEE